MVAGKHATMAAMEQLFGVSPHAPCSTARAQRQGDAAPDMVTCVGTVGRWHAARRVRTARIVRGVPLVALLVLAGTNSQGLAADTPRPAVTATAPTGHGQTPVSLRPQIVLDEPLRSAWKRAAQRPNTTVARAISKCRAIAADSKEYDRDVYMSFTWTAAIQHCLIAYVATPAGSVADGYARTVIRYLTATLDDLQVVGDGKGGDDIIKRDSGYSVRVIVPFTALAVDWLGGHPALTPTLRAHAIARWTTWLTWYAAQGYNARRAGANYQAGYLLAASLAWRVQGATARALGDHVVTQLWGQDMATALAADGLLAGGDWPEGQQYAPLAIVSYAFAARALQDVGGVPHQLLGAYLTHVMARHVAGQSPDGKVFAGGDTDTPQPNIEPSMLTLAAVAMGAASDRVRAAAIEELRARKLHFDDFILYEALVLDGPQPAGAPARLRDANATAYVAAGTQTFFARSDWSPQSPWLVTNCGLINDMDHRPADAGNLVFSRGTDAIVVDPSPYGSLSTLTSNAPSVRSAQLPAEYTPSQGTWGRATGLRWAKQTPRGVMLASCDYADQYRFKDQPSDVARATRDIVGLPLANSDFALVIADVAETGARTRELNLRFRVPTKLTLKDRRANGRIGHSTVTVTQVASSPPSAPHVTANHRKDCWAEDVPRGQCTAARFPVDEFAMQVPGPKAAVLSVVTATGATTTAETVEVQGSNVRFGARVQQQVALWAAQAGPVSYEVPATDRPSLHVLTSVHDLVGTPAGNRCKFQGTATAASAPPTVWVVDQNCRAVAEDGRRALLAEQETQAGMATSVQPRENAPAFNGHAGGRPGEVGSNGTKRTPKTGSCTAAGAAPGAWVIGLVFFFHTRRRRIGA